MSHINHSSGEVSDANVAIDAPGARAPTPPPVTVADAVSGNVSTVTTAVVEAKDKDTATQPVDLETGLQMHTKEADTERCESA